MKRSEGDDLPKARDPLPATKNKDPHNLEEAPEVLVDHLQKARGGGLYWMALGRQSPCPLLRKRQQEQDMLISQHEVIMPYQDFLMDPNNDLGATSLREQQTTMVDEYTQKQ